VDSHTYSTPASPQGISEGSLARNTLITWLLGPENATSTRGAGGRSSDGAYLTPDLSLTR
jgi:hypothetical protein